MNSVIDVLKTLTALLYQQYSLSDSLTDNSVRVVEQYTVQYSKTLTLSVFGPNNTRVCEIGGVVLENAIQFFNNTWA